MLLLQTKIYCIVLVFADQISAHSQSTVTELEPTYTFRGHKYLITLNLMIRYFLLMHPC